MTKAKKVILSAHVQTINSLIPEAVEEADRMMKNHNVKFVEKPGVDGELYKHDLRSQYFHRAMNRMAREAGLRN